MTYTASPPYEILQNKLLDFATLQRLRRFAKYWDLVSNSGNFVVTTPLIWAGVATGLNGELVSPFHSFLRFSDWVYNQLGRTDTIALVRLAEALFDFLTGERAMDKTIAADSLWRDWQQAGRRDPPEFLRAHLPEAKVTRAPAAKSSLPKRQARHLAVQE
jgi:hypothetical protein